MPSRLGATLTLLLSLMLSLGAGVARAPEVEAATPDYGGQYQVSSYSVSGNTPTPCAQLGLFAMNGIFNVEQVDPAHVALEKIIFGHNGPPQSARVVAVSADGVFDPGVFSDGPAVPAGTEQVTGRFTSSGIGDGTIVAVYNASQFGQKYAGTTCTGSWTAKKLSAAANPPTQAFTLKITKITGDVLWRRAGADWADASVSQLVGIKDEVQCGAESEITLEVADGSVVVVKQLSQMRIASLTTAAGRTQAQMLLKMGELTLGIKRNEGVTTDLSIKTPTATASVRGSQMTVAYDPAAQITTVSVQEDQATVQALSLGTPQSPVTRGSPIGDWQPGQPYGETRTLGVGERLQIGPTGALGAAGSASSFPLSYLAIALAAAVVLIAGLWFRRTRPRATRLP